MNILQRFEARSILGEAPLPEHSFILNSTQITKKDLRKIEGKSKIMELYAFAHG